MDTFTSTYSLEQKKKTLTQLSIEADGKGASA
jgi:hypothetical protein